MPTDKKIIYSYLAGFIDADGSISIVTASYNQISKDGSIQRRTQYCIKLSAHNCKIEPIQLLQQEFGGGKLRHKKTGKAKLHPKWRPCYEWILTKDLAAKAIKCMLPYLLIKKEQAIICLELDDLKKRHSAAERRWNIQLGKEVNSKFQELKEKINILNKRGQ